MDKLLEQLFLYDEGDLEKEKHKIEEIHKDAAQSVIALSIKADMAPETMLRIIGRMSAMTTYKWYEVISILNMFYNIKRQVEKESAK